MLLDLPTELLWEVLTAALGYNTAPADIFCAHSRFRTIGYRILYTRLRFRTVRQLAEFAQHTTPAPCPPRELSVTLSGGTVDFDVFKYLADALTRCARAHGGDSQKAPLELLSLCLNSHASNPNLGDIYRALVIAR